jgi:WD40 repeat protein
VYRLPHLEKVVDIDHGYRIYSVCFSSGGESIVTGSNHQQATVYNLESGKEVSVYRGRSTVWVATYSTCGHYLGMGDFANYLQVFDVRTDEIVLTENHKNPVRCIVFSRSMMAVGGQNCRVFLYDLETWTKFAEIAVDSFVGAVAFSPNEMILLVGSYSGVLTWHDARTGIVLRKTALDGGTIFTAAFSPDFSTYIVGQKSGVLTVFDTLSSCVCNRINRDAEVHNAFFTSDAKHLAVGGYDNRLVFYSTDAGRLVHEFDVVDGEANIVCPSPDGTMLAVGGKAKHLHVFDLMSKDAELWHIEHIGIFAMAFSPDSSKLATAGSKYVFYVYDTSTQELLFERRRPTGDWSTVICFVLRGAAVAVGGGRYAEQGTHIYDSTTGDLLLTLEGGNFLRSPPMENMQGGDIASSLAGDILAVGGHSRALSIYRVAGDGGAGLTCTLAAGRELGEIVSAVHVADSGDRVFAGCCNGDFFIFDIPDMHPGELGGELGGELRATLPESVEHGCFSSDGKMLAVSDSTWTLHLYNTDPFVPMHRVAFGQSEWTTTIFHRFYFMHDPVSSAARHLVCSVGQQVFVVAVGGAFWHPPVEMQRHANRTALLSNIERFPALLSAPCTSDGGWTLLQCLIDAGEDETARALLWVEPSCCLALDAAGQTSAFDTALRCQADGVLTDLITAVSTIMDRQESGMLPTCLIDRVLPELATDRFEPIVVHLLTQGWTKVDPGISHAVAEQSQIAALVGRRLHPLSHPLSRTSPYSTSVQGGLWEDLSDSTKQSEVVARRVPWPHLARHRVLSALVKLESVRPFETGMLHAVVEAHWSAYARRHFIQHMLVHLLWTCSFTWLALIITAEESSSVGARIATSAGCLAGSAFVFCYEIKQLMAEGFQSYASDPWNALHVVSASLVVYVTVSFLFGGANDNLRSMAALTTIFLYLGVIFFARGFDRTAAIVRMLLQVISDCVAFMSVVFVLVAGFGISMHILYKNDDAGDDELLKSASGSLLWAFTAGILLDFDVDTLRRNSVNSQLAITIFVSQMALISLVSLNALIAFMGDSYSRVAKTQVAERMRERAALVCESLMLMGAEKRHEIEEQNAWTHVLVPARGLCDFLSAFTKDDSAREVKVELEALGAQVKELKQLIMLRGRDSSSGAVAAAAAAVVFAKRHNQAMPPASEGAVADAGAASNAAVPSDAANAL